MTAPDPGIVPLLYHSHYGRGGSRFETLFERLSAYGYRSCGIVDATLFGLPEFLHQARGHGIKPLVGGHFGMPEPLFLFARNHCGYQNLCRLITAQSFGRLTREMIRQHSSGLVLVSPSAPLLEDLGRAFTDIFHLVPPFHHPSTHRFPLIAGQAIIAAAAEDRILHRLLAAIKKFPAARGEQASHLPRPETFVRGYRDHPDALENNRRIAELCDFVPCNTGWVFPRTTADLACLLKDALRSATRAQRKRIAYEYRLVKELGFEAYFTLVYELKEFARSQRIGMNVRGSAASSYILYALGLSVVDPIKNHLPFERFLNPGRSEPPDIDVDVEFNQRDRLIRQIYQKFGPDFVAQIGVVNRFQSRARFRDTARAFGITPFELKRLHEHIGEKLMADICRLAERIDGYPHYFSCHPSGIVITPDPVTDYVPLFPTPTGPVTNFDKDGVAVQGLVKIDILGVRGFPALYLHKERISLGEDRTYDFIAQGRTLGCFQIESPAVRQMLKRIRPRSLMAIANAIAIIRPGPAQGGMKEHFLKRLDGTEAVDYLHPALRPALRETLGIPVYQEQILQMAHDFARIDLEEADLLRRAITKDRHARYLQELRDRFIQRARAIGRDGEEIERVWERIASFSAFGFNKAHSLTYATLAYLSAYQKLHDPIAFFCRTINNKGGYYPVHAYINEARRWGITIQGPDVKRSAAGFTAAPSGAGRSIITGLQEIQNLSAATIERIIERRPFDSVQQFYRNVAPAEDEILPLVRSGAMDSFGEPWPRMYFAYLAWRQAHQEPARRRAVYRCNRILIPGIPEEIPAFTDFAREQKLHAALRVLGFIPQCHVIEFACPNRSIRIAQLRPEQCAVVQGFLIARRIIYTKQGSLMAFLTIDDETGILEAVVFPDRFKYFPGVPIVEVHGTMDDGSLIARSARPLSSPRLPIECQLPPNVPRLSHHRAA